MNKFLLKKIIKSVILSMILTFIVVVAVDCMTQTTVDVNGTIDKTVLTEEKIIIRLQEDEKHAFVFSDVEDFGADFLAFLSKGDVVTLTVTSDYQKSKNVAIKKLVYEDEVIFDFVEKQKNDDFSMAFSFMLASIVSVVVWLFLILTDKEKLPSLDGSFCIKNSKFVKNFSLSLISFSLVSGISCVILFLCNKMSNNAFSISFLYLIFLVIGIVCLILYYKEKFIFKDGTYTYVKLIKKPQSVYYKDVYCLNFEIKRVVKVSFLDKYRKPLLEFMDDGTAFKSGEFLKSLAICKLPISVLIPPVTFGELKSVLLEMVDDGLQPVVDLWIREKIYSISLNKEGCTLKRLGEEDLIKFNTLDELYVSEGFDGIKLVDCWDEIDKAEFLTYNYDEK